MARTKRSYDGELLTATVCFQAKPSERQQLRAAAKLAATSVSDVIRAFCFGRGQPTVAGTRRNPEAKALLAELKAIGNNLNQLARHANSVGALVEYRELDALIAILKAAMARVISL
jgi:hypothetical protein